VRLRSFSTEAGLDGVLFGDSWGQITLVKGFHARPASSWTDFVGNTLENYTPHDEQGQQVLGWFCAVQNEDESVAAADYFDGFKCAVVRKTLNELENSGQYSVPDDLQEACVNKANNVCRRLVGIVFSRSVRNEDSCEILKMEWQGYTYVPHKSDLQSTVENVRLESAPEVAVPTRVMKRDRDSDIMRHCGVPVNAQPLDTQQTRLLKDCKARVDNTKVAFEVHGGSASKLFLMYKGGGPTEQHVHHFNTSLEEIALGMCKGDAAEHTDFQDEECSRASKIKKQQEEGINWKQQAIQDTLK